MERTDGLDGEVCSLFQKVLNLHAIFAYDVEIVAASLASPVVGFVFDSTELAESVGGKESAVGCVEREHDFGPVNHRGCYESEAASAEAEGVALFHLLLVAYGDILKI